MKIIGNLLELKEKLLVKIKKFILHTLKKEKEHWCSLMKILMH